MKKPDLTFSTREEAETYLATNGKGLAFKARHIGGKWFLVHNVKRTVTKSLFIKMFIEAHKADGLTIEALRHTASAYWNQRRMAVTHRIRRSL